MLCSKNLAVIASVGCLAFVAGRESAPPQEGAAAKAQEPVTEHHALLAPFEGTFRADAKFFGPDSPPIESGGKMVNSWVLGGRYLAQDYSGETMGMAFQGLGYWGFGEMSEAYQGVWIDSWSTEMVFASGGTVSEDGKVFTTLFEMQEPTSSEPVQKKDVIRLISQDQHTFTRYTVTDEGETKGMEIVYARM